jgi:membrane fusion protein, multidrug efflux system
MDTDSAGATRRRALLSLALLVLIAAVVATAWWLSVGRYRASTEDAYVSGNIIELTPQVYGTVIAIRADETDLVRAGSAVVELDPADASVALDEATAALARAVREVRALYATTDQLRSTLNSRETELARARADLARRAELAGSGAVSAEDVAHAETASRAAEQAADAARSQLAGQRAQTEGTALASHPQVLQAAGRVREAYLALARQHILAPVTGFVAKRSVQLGQRVQPGTALLAIVPLDEVWVEANFKEDQLGALRLGQPAKLIADVYGSQLPFSGRVVGLAAGTGSAFAALPAQNATGNWIKVVQRLPVRIALDPEELRAHPLRIGLSMRVEVAVKERAGAMLAAAPPAATRYQTASLALELAAADRLIEATIAANAGGHR